MSQYVYSKDNAGIYLTSINSINDEFLQLHAPEASITSKQTDTGKSYTVSWAKTVITINTRVSWPDRDTQINGMQNWLRSISSGTDSEESLIKKIPTVIDLVGCVIEPRYDQAGRVTKLLKAIASTHSGIIFTNQSFYSSEGMWLSGQLSAVKEL